MSRKNAVIARRLGRVAGKLAAGVRAASEVRRRTGKGYLSQIVEVVRARFGPARLYPGEYYARRVYDDEVYPGRRKTEVVGRRVQRELWRSANDPGWTSVVSDKLVFQWVFAGLGFPVPELLAVHHPGHRFCGEVPTLRGHADVVEFLLRSPGYPIFGKPVSASMGIGATLIRGVDGRRVLLGGDVESADVDTFVRTRILPFSRGFLFQRVVETHPELHGIQGRRLTTVRVMALSGEEGPRILRAIWRAPLGSSVTDNFDGGKAGNLVAELDPSTGEVTRAMRGTGAPAGPRGFLSFPIEEVDVHPESGVPLRGMVVPEWGRVARLVRTAQASLPGFRWVGWDVALSREGPLFLEANHKPFLPRLPGGPGGYYSELCRLLERGRTA